MGTTRIKVVDLSSEKEQIKTSRKHAEKLAGPSKLKEEKAKKEEDKEEKLKEEQKAETLETKKETKTSSQKVTAKKTHHQGKKYLQAKSLIDKNKNYPLKEAIDLLHQTSVSKFDPTVEVHMNLIDKNIRGRVNYPNPIISKKERKILVFADKPQDSEDKNIIWGNEKTIEEIAEGKLKPQRDFDQIFALPKYMPALAKVAKVLGPAQMMPNPKSQTIIENAKAVTQKAQDSAFEYRSESNAPLLHTKIGKLSFKNDQLEQNLKALIFAIGPAKIKKAVLKSTMSPSIRLDLQNISK